MPPSCSSAGAAQALAPDPAAAVYAQRCRELLADPQAAWDSVWNLSSK